MIEHGETALVARRVDGVDESAQLLFRVISGLGLLPHMAVESRNRYEAKYALSVVARNLAACLEGACYQEGLAQ